jgi:hypothetical protein
MSRLVRAWPALVFVLVACGSRTELLVPEASEIDSGNILPPDGGQLADASRSMDAAPPPDSGRMCVDRCFLAFASGPTWPSFDGPPVPSGGALHGASLGPARDVCLNAGFPVDCPADAVDYGYLGAGWTAGAALAGSWIWRGDVTPMAPADLAFAVFETSFSLGSAPAGTITIGTDDSATVYVNGTSIATVGSVVGASAASMSSTSATSFDLTPALHAGTNTITVVGQNGPASFAGGCGADGCNYSQNPAGVVFAGSFTWN